MKISQDALAHLANIHRVYLGGIERGENNVTIEVVEKIAEALNVNAGSLLD